jgi:hypothetical protein
MVGGSADERNEATAARTEVKKSALVEQFVSDGDVKAAAAEVGGKLTVISEC